MKKKMNDPTAYLHFWDFAGEQTGAKSPKKEGGHIWQLILRTAKQRKI